MDELDLTEKTPRTLDEEDLRDEHTPRAAPRTARGTRSHTVPPPLPAMRLAAAPPAKLISFLPPPEPQSPVPGSFPVVRAPSNPEPPAEPTARGSIAPRVTEPSTQMSVPNAPAPVAPEPLDAIDIEIDEPVRESTGDVVRAARPRRHTLVIAGIAVCATLVGTGVGLLIRSARGPRPAAPVPPALAVAPAPGSDAPSSVPSDVPSRIPSSAPAVEIAATISAAAAPPAPTEPSDDEPPRTDLPITTQPDGATVTLIANGDATVLGKTPITASVDPTLSYDVVFAFRDRPTTILHFDASKVHELAVDLTPRALPVPARRAPRR